MAIPKHKPGELEPVLVPVENKRPYYVWLKDGRFEEEPEAKRVVLDAEPEGDYFYTKSKTLYTISDAKTGQKIAFGDKLIEAKENACRQIELQNKSDGMDSLRERAISNNGISPRYRDLETKQLEVKNYLVYRNTGGFLEGYKSTATGFDRVVSNATTEQEFREFLHKPRQKTYDPYNDPNQLRIE